MKEALENKLYTYEDYLKFPEGERIELISGVIYAMTPAPSRIHQKVITELSRKIGNYIDSKKGECEVYVAPFDVIFLEEGEKVGKNKDIVQPDISVICDKAKLDDKGCIGAPDFIIEVVSPSNSSMDYVKKLFLYEKFKVREYWIVNPISKNILVYKLNKNGQYEEPEKYCIEDNIKAGIFEDLYISFIGLLSDSKTLGK